MAVTVGNVIGRVKTILLESGTGVRWGDSELLDWLNEAYLVLAPQRIDAVGRDVTLSLAAGTRQRLPDDALGLVDVVGNAAGMAVRETSRRALSSVRRQWMQDPATDQIEQFARDETDPLAFHVYPPALETAQLEVLYAAYPTPHATASLAAVTGMPIGVRDQYAPALADYILFRAFSKDAEDPNLLARAQMHYAAWSSATAPPAEARA